ncbi:MAG: JAB domain-containing protein [Candidatus Obscuribacterales bacterium]
MNSTVDSMLMSESKSGSASQVVIRDRRTKQKAQSKATSKKVSSRMLKNHLKYIVPQMKLALIRESGPEPIVITSADSIGQFVEPLRHSSEEYFIAFHLDCKLRVTGFHEVSHGTLSASLVHSREVFKAALLNNSHAIIVAHNHPSGIEDASKEDIETTKRLIAGGELLGVQVIDHVIVTASSLYSLRENYSHLWF